LSDDDHRVVAQRLDLFHFREESPGMVFWHPAGHLLYRLLEDAVRQHLAAQGYSEVATPQILRRPVWESSGHWEHFHDGMFFVQDQSREAAVKPVSCPGHIYIAGHRGLSYRDLPVRLAEFGVVHRDEPGGTLHGLLRLRQFTQDDGHIFCLEEQAQQEVARFCEAVRPFYAAFGFSEVSVALSTRPVDHAGDDALWDLSEGALRRALGDLGIAHSVQPGAGAFYGPKIEFVLRDRHGRDWQCGTIQYDLVMPRRFDVRYVDSDGQRKHVVMLHRALYGSLERFLGMVLEQHGAHLPLWLAPRQAVVVPVSSEQSADGAELVRRLRDRGIRASLDGRSESLSRRIADAHQEAVPVVCVVGRKEVAEGSVSVRWRDGVRAVDRDAAVEELVERCRWPALARWVGPIA